MMCFDRSLTTAKEPTMTTRQILSAVMTGILTVGGCSANQQSTRATHGGAEPAEAGETKVKLEQTPPAVRDTIRHELVGAELEDIARKSRDGQTVYETDIIKNGK